ncbi:hypothetical protein AB4Z48_19000 [Cupriavidus sp. 2TAF22]|uniref:hypothetical protein n=1 Tax=unclassified Cupriavidus TaxID=2640874 RepID=UPI003F926366
MPRRPSVLAAAFAPAVAGGFAVALAMPAGAAPGADAKLVAEATQGQLKALKGKVFDKSCNESVDYDAAVVDLNGDGQPEVFTNFYGTCVGGMAGVSMQLYVKDGSGRWQPQFGFPGQATVLKTKHLGYPDIEIGGPGNCFPVWRWNGAQYAPYKKCAR